MYHFFSPRSGAADSPCGASVDAPASALFGWPESVPPALSATLAIDQLREVRPDEVEHAEDHRGDDRHDDDNEGGRTDFLGGRPGDLLELAGDLVRQVVDAVVTIERDANDHGSDPG